MGKVKVNKTMSSNLPLILHLWKTTKKPHCNSDFPNKTEENLILPTSKATTVIDWNQIQCGTTFSKKYHSNKKSIKKKVHDKLIHYFKFNFNTLFYLFSWKYEVTFVTPMNPGCAWTASLLSD